MINLLAGQILATTKKKTRYFKRVTEESHRRNLSKLLVVKTYQMTR